MLHVQLLMIAVMKVQLSLISNFAHTMYTYTEGMFVQIVYYEREIERNLFMVSK